MDSANDPGTSKDTPDPPVIEVSPDEAEALARLLRDFQLEFEVPTPPVEDVTDRLRTLLVAGEVTALLIGNREQPVGLAVLRFRTALFYDSTDAYLEELYVVPGRRGDGLGRRLMEAVLDLARERGCGRIELGTEEDDTAARGLYESLGFTNRDRGELMFFYERDL